MSQGVIVKKPWKQNLYKEVYGRRVMRATKVYQGQYYNPMMFSANQFRLIA